MRRRPVRHVRFLRSFLLGLLALSIAAVLGLYWLGRGATPPVRPSDDTDVELGGEGVAYEARGFDHTVSVGDRNLFRVRAERTATTTGDGGGQPLLQGVDLTFYREDGSEYGVSASRGSYNFQTEQAELRGEVEVRSPDGFILWTDRLRLNPARDWLASAPGVRFQINSQLTGQARRLRADLDKNVFQLAGPVTISGTGDRDEPLGLRAQDVILYERDSGLIRAEGNVVVQQGESRIWARRISAWLDESSGNLRSVVARWEVEGELRPREGQTVEVTSEELHAEFDSTSRQLERLDLIGAAEEPARLREVGGPVTRTITGPRMEGLFVDGDLSSVRATGGAHLAETRQVDGASVVRTGEGQELTARFTPDGILAEAELRRRVVFREGDYRVAGDHAVMNAARDTVVVTGAPARAQQTGRELNAPVLHYELASGRVRGDQGVHGSFDSADDAGLPVAKRPAERPPMNIEAESLEVDTRASTFVFTGRVQAWQGESYLLADRLAGREAGQLLEADGQVKTVWQTAEGSADGPTTTTEISGSRLVYSRAAGLATYFAPAAVRQGPRTMSCDRIEGQVDPRGEVRRVLCIGGVRIDDAETDRQVTGDHAVYEVGTGEIEVTGRNVTVRQQDGSQVTGARRVIYRLDDGVAEIVGVEEERQGVGSQAASRDE